MRASRPLCSGAMRSPVFGNPSVVAVRMVM
jgi:hypothetical protein